MEEWDTSAAIDLPSSAELHQELQTSLVRTGAWDWSKVVRAVAPRVSVGLGGFLAGYEIGSKIYGLFVDEADPPSTESYYADKWQLVKPGQQIFSSDGGTVYAPSWGVWEYNSALLIGRETNTGACELILYGDGSRLYAPNWTPASFCGITRYRGYAVFKPGYPVPCDIVGCPGINPTSYDGTGQPTLPTAEEFQDHLRNELDTGQYPVLNRWLNHEAKPLLFPDPRVPKTNNANNHRCDRSLPNYENPGGNTDPDPYTVKDPTPYTATVRPSGATDSPDPYLRWGSAEWQGGYLDSWNGWGWRHIQAKHGWSSADESATRQALAAPVVTLEDSSTAMTYQGATYTQNGALCARTVKVEFSEATGPKGIITSFGNYLGEAP